MDKGSIFALLGSNGAGKTTVVKEDYLRNNGDFEFDETENKRPMNIWLYAKCRTFLDSDYPEQEVSLLLIANIQSF
ncbi:hypothetical protein CN563_19130 [Bacillus sp. AFS026049]|uniref:hypothetical protein n=1 Tax=Peribacillus frigoritolerans TaxID=450367 RepID=UPI000BEBBD92|nr:hypothetical protein CON84_19155 [Bacillus sp. AFS094228]PEO44785.1 hypothetical protein CN563_19130 [Bacillus sp. AFS026049]